MKTSRLHSLLLLTGLTATTALGQTHSSTYYGAPSAAFGPATPAVSLELVTSGSGFPMVQVDGGRPGDLAVLLLALRPFQGPLLGNSTLLVDPGALIFTDFFDAAGTARFQVEPRFPFPLYYQGGDVTGAPGITELRMSRGMTVTSMPPAQPFDPFRLHLPANRTPDVAKALGVGNLASAYATMLDSDGDVTDLAFEGGASVGLVLNFGISMNFGAELARVEDSGTFYEVKIGAGLAASLGVELAQGVEGNAALSGGGSTVYRFSSLAAAGKGIEAIAITQALGPFGTSTASNLISSWQSKLAGYKSDLSRLQSALNSLLAVPSFLRTSAWTKQYNQVQSGISAAKKGIALAQQALAEVASLVTQLKNGRSYLDSHKAASEYRLALTGSVEAAIGIPGVQLEGVGAGASAASSLGVRVRVEEVPSGMPQVVTITRYFDNEVSLWAALVVGGELHTIQGIEMVDTVLVQNGRMAGNLDSYVRFASDTRLLGSLGVGVAGKYGVARELAISVPTSEIQRVGWQVIGAFLSVKSFADLSAVGDALGSATAHFEVQDRYEAGLVAKFGLSVLGTGGYMGGSSFWRDRGTAGEEILTAKQAIQRLVVQKIVPALETAVGTQRSVVAAANGS